MIMREKLLTQMSSFAAQNKWQDLLTDTINQILEVRPSNPYLFLHKKISLKQKLDNSKSNQYLLELTMYITTIDPSITPQQIIKDKIISLCVEKFQHTKIKKAQIFQLVSVILVSLQATRRQIFVKSLELICDREIYSILQYAAVIYHTIVFRAAMNDVSQLEKKLGTLKIELTKPLFQQWINTINQQSSIIKQLNLQFEQTEIVNGLAMAIIQRVNI